MDRWEQRTGWPLTTAAAVFLIAYAWPILDPDLPSNWSRALDLFGLAIWLPFVIDYAVRLHLANDRRRFVRSHLIDLAVIALPMLRPLRALRVLRAVVGSDHGHHCGLRRPVPDNRGGSARRGGADAGRHRAARCRDRDVGELVS